MATSKQFNNLNRYNWFGQKLLTLHQFDDIIDLHHHLTNSKVDSIKSSNENHNVKLIQFRRPASNQLSFMYGLALIKTSINLNEVINILQSLDFEKNNQYFLILCQCLLYLGNHDSVVALCKQIINKEIDSVKSNTIDSNNKELLIDTNTDDVDSNADAGSTSDILNDNDNVLKRTGEQNSEFLSDESLEFKRIFSKISKNSLINEPKLWFIFGLCLEYQFQYKDAQFAFKMAMKLSMGATTKTSIDNSDKQHHHHHHHQRNHNQRHRHHHHQNEKPPQQQPATTISDEIKVAAMKNYYTPHLKFADYCIRYDENFKLAIQTLTQASSIFSKNHNVDPMLALTVVSQPIINSEAINKSIKIISKLESHSASNRNPAFEYIDFVLKFKDKKQSALFYDRYNSSSTNCNNDGEFRSNLNYLLVKSHIMLNELLQEFNCRLPLTNSRNQFSTAHGNNDYQSIVSKRVDRLIDSIRASGPSCWSSASLWNNLGICYLIKRRFIACLSCLMKAQSIDPLNWRINYNIALACMNVGLLTKAFVHLIAAKNLYSNDNWQSIVFDNLKSLRINKDQICPLIATLLGICYENFGQIDEARQLHFETIRPLNKSNLTGLPVLPLVNYLIFLHKTIKHNDDDSNSEQHMRLELHLLDQLEQAWLQRNLNDSQFNTHLLEVANQIGKDIFNSTTTITKKSYAWTKVDPILSEIE